jgi:hypothetical protein
MAVAMTETHRKTYVAVHCIFQGDRVMTAASEPTYVAVHRLFDRAKETGTVTVKILYPPSCIPPRGTVFGERVGGPALSEAENYFKCPVCLGYFDFRDLGAVLDHEEPLPHPGCDQVN